MYFSGQTFLHCGRIAARAVPAAMLLSIYSGASLAQTDQQGCPDEAQVETGRQAFDTFCGRCHLAEKLAGQIRDAADPAQAETELTAFLKNHGPCPHDRHAAIAAYLRLLSGR